MIGSTRRDGGGYRMLPLMIRRPAEVERGDDEEQRKKEKGERN
jgi:hypothetical protein